MMEIRYDNKVDLIEAKTVMSSDVLIVDNDGEIFAICLYEDGTVSFELNGVEIYFERVSNYVTGNQIVNSELKLSDYTYDEFIMYYTMTLGYGAILDALKNPKTAEILGISYNPENKMAYFCVLAENDFGGNTKSYISFGYNRRSITESDNLKDDYDSSSIHRTMDDLMLFMKAAENADESEMPTDDIDSKLAMYSENDKKMFALFAEGGDYVDNWYDNVFVIGYKYDSSTETAYFYFMGDDIDGIASTYARYNEEFGFDAHDAFEQQYNSADITIYQYEIDNYMESIAPKITK